MQKNKRQPELADIFRKYGEDYRRRHFLSTEQSKTMYHIEICRTAVLGPNGKRLVVAGPSAASSR